MKCGVNLRCTATFPGLEEHGVTRGFVFMIQAQRRITEQDKTGKKQKAGSYVSLFLAPDEERWNEEPVWGSR